MRWESSVYLLMTEVRVFPENGHYCNFNIPSSIDELLSSSSLSMMISTLSKLHVGFISLVTVIQSASHACLTFTSLIILCIAVHVIKGLVAKTKFCLSIMTRYTKWVTDVLWILVVFLGSSLPGDSRTRVGVMTYDGSLHFYNLQEGLTRPQMLVVTDTEGIFCHYYANSSQM